MVEYMGVIAGSGSSPFLIIKEAQKQGVRCVVAGIREEADEALQDSADVFEWIGLEELSELLVFFKKHSVKKAVMAGKVEHRRIFQSKKSDTVYSRLFSRMIEKSPVQIIQRFIDFMAEAGVQFIEPTVFLSSYFCEEGFLTEHTHSLKLEEDINFGLKIARKIADLDIGQTVVVKDKAVVAVEGMEGTDETIRRGGKLAGRGFVVAKVGRTSQDMRIDLPAVGLSTVKALVKGGGKALCIEARKVLFFEKEQAVSLANAKNILILARKNSNM